MAATCISSLGYVGFRVADPDAWHDYATGILGVMPAAPHGDTRRYRIDEQGWRVAVDRGEEDDIVYAGFEVPHAAALHTVAARLAEAGVEVHEGDDALRRERDVLGLIHCRDPDGMRIEIYYGPAEVPERPFASPAGVSGFVTEGQGLGHIVVGTADLARSHAFYRDALGFRLSDIIAMAIGPDVTLDLEFYHCNARHHSLALVPAPTPKRLHHFMLQTRSLDDVGLALDRLTAAQMPLVQTLGRHSNDHMVSFYALTPGGFQVEYGWGARDVDEETWRVVRHRRTSVWGHKFAHAPQH